MSTFLDTNCLLRYLLADIEDQFETVCQHVENGACTSPEFIAECVYVLGGTVYGFDRTDVANTMTAPGMTSPASTSPPCATPFEPIGTTRLISPTVCWRHASSWKAPPCLPSTKSSTDCWRNSRNPSPSAPLRGELFPLAYTRAVALAGAQAMAHNTECFMKSRGLRKPVRYGNSVAVRIRHVGHAHLRRGERGSAASLARCSRASRTALSACFWPSPAAS